MARKKQDDTGDKKEDKAEKKTQTSSEVFMESSKIRANEVRDRINANFKGVVGVKTADQLDCNVLHRLRTGSVSLDYLTGGGFVRGSIMQFKGKDSSCKTSTAVKAAAWTQRHRGVNNIRGSVLMCFTEKPDRLWLRKLGLIMPFDPEELEAMPEEYRERLKDYGKDYTLDFLIGEKGPELLTAIVEAVEANIYDLIIIDSINAIMTAEDMGDVEKSAAMDKFQVGRDAKLKGKFAMRTSLKFNKLYDPETGAPVLANQPGRSNYTVVIIISQMRVNITPTFSFNDATSGGWAIRHLKHFDILFDRQEYIHVVDKDLTSPTIGANIKIKIDKNKHGQPDRAEILTFYFDTSYAENNFDTYGEILNFAEVFGIIQKKSAYYYIGDTTIQGKPKAVEFLKANPEIATQLMALIYQKIDGDRLGTFWDVE